MQGHFEAEAEKGAATGPAAEPGQAAKSLDEAAAGQLTWYEQRARDHWARTGAQGA